MARILITGSSDGLGSLAAQRLVKNGHSVILHARSAQRAKDAREACPGAEAVVVGDLSSMAETKKLAEDVNKLGALDVVIHNAGLYRGPMRTTSEGLAAIAAVNTFAPYILTSLISPRPKRLVFLSSGLHRGGDGSLKDITWAKRGEKGFASDQAYADTKLHNILFANAFARKWPTVHSNSMDPGWVATKMGGSSAPDDPNVTMKSYLALAEGESLGKGSGQYIEPGPRVANPRPEAADEATQEKLLKLCEEVTGVKVPTA